MIVAALLDAGCDFEALQGELARLGLQGCSSGCRRVQRGGISGLRFTVRSPDDSPPARRGLTDVLTLIEQAGLADRATERASRIFARLAEAEAKVHACGVDEVHFHEVGAVDSITDVVGACVALELLEVDRVYCSVIPVGGGTIECAHGVMPVPAPATAELLRGVPTRPGGLETEMTTPTAAAVLTTLADSFGAMPPMNVSTIGYGAGTRETDALPNLLRVFVGEPAEPGTADTVVELSANLDDCTGEMIAAALEALLEAGCLDAWATPVVMKSSRPAWQLSALCEVAGVAAAEEILFAQTTTFGVRRRMCDRTKLDRGFETAETPYGPIRMKVGRLRGRVVTASPEFAACRTAAEAHNVAVREVMAAAQAAWRRGEHR